MIMNDDDLVGLVINLDKNEIKHWKYLEIISTFPLTLIEYPLFTTLCEMCEVYIYQRIAFCT